MSTLVLVSFCPATANGQTVLGGTQAENRTVPSVSLSTGVERDINRYRWIFGAGAEARFGQWAMLFDNQFTSDALILFQNQLSFRDANRARLMLKRPLTSRAELRIGGTSNWYSLSRVYNQHTYIGGRITDGSNWIEPRLGFALDSRPGIGPTPAVSPSRTDAGPLAGFAAYMNLTDDGTYNAEVNAGGSYERISPRQSHKIFANGNTLARFNDTQLSGTVMVVTTRRDAYQATSFLNRENVVSESIEATTSDTLAVATTLTAPIRGGFSINGTITFGSNARHVRNPNPDEETLFFETDFSRRDVETTVNLLFETRRVNSRLTFHGGIEEEQRTLSNRDRLPAVQATQKANLLRQADFDRGYYALTFYNRIDVTRRITATGDATINLLRHDTPEINPDDRDERFIRSQLGIRGIISPYFSTDVQIFATRYETVYLKAIRSAENNVQRSLRLRPGFNWTPSRQTRIRIGTEIRATYTVDDFVLGGRRPRDQSARELAYELDGNHHFPGGVSVLFSGEQSDLRLGRFFEDTFSEIPFDTLQTTAGWVRVRVGQKAQAEIGVRLFQRRDFNQSTLVRYNRYNEDGTPVLDVNDEPVVASIVRQGKERITQIGPTTSITWPVSRDATIRADGWLTFQHVTRRLYGDIPEADRDEILQAARSGTRTTIPNLSLTVSWAF